MADFHAHGLDQKVDHLMDLLFGAGVNSHATIIEQINYLLFLRALSIRDQELIDLGIEDKEKIVFDGGLSEYRWENLLMLNPDSLFIALEKCYTKISESTSNRTVRLLFRDAHLKIYDKPTLRRLVHEIDKFAKELEIISDKGQKDIFGDMYEYLLSKLNQSGTAGQFRTPRHIIEFIVKVLDLSKGETILDPAVGTAGFLVKAYEHLAYKYTSEKYVKEGSFSFDKLNTEEKQFLYNHTFTGFDSDSDMIKFGMMNLFLHGLENARLLRQNTLTDTAGNREKWDVILANPPFAGKIDRESVAEDLQMGTGATEILFLRYMIDHLSENGRIGVIVPEGVVFSNSTAHKKIRQMLIQKGLWCVVSLPAGVFNPYAGVKTSVLFIDKTLNNKVKEVLFVTIENDGFELGAAKRKIGGDQIPTTINEINQYKNFVLSGNTHNNVFLERIKRDREVGDILITRHDRFLLIAKSEIEKKDYNLSSSNYRTEEIFRDQKWPIVKVGSIFETSSGGTPLKSREDFYKNGTIPWLRSGEVAQGLVTKSEMFITDKGLKNSSAKIFPPNTVLVAMYGATAGQVGLLKFYSSTNQAICALLPNDKAMPEFTFYILKSLKEKMVSMAGGGAQPNISQTIIKDLEIPLPPLEIQEQNVRELDGYTAIINGARQIVTNWQPKIDIDPRWQKAKIGGVASLMTGGTPSTSKKEYYKSGNIKWLVSGDIHKGEIFDCKGRITELALKKSNARLLPINSVLIALNGQGKTRGTVAILRVPASCNQSLVSINPNRNKLIPEFLLYQLRSKYQEIRDINGDKQRGGLNMTIIRSIEIFLPPIEIQKQIVEKIEAERELVESAKKLIAIYEQKIKDKISEVWGEKKKENV